MNCLTDYPGPRVASNKVSLAQSRHHTLARRLIQTPYSSSHAQPCRPPVSGGTRQRSTHEPKNRDDFQQKETKGTAMYAASAAG